MGEAKGRPEQRTALNPASASAHFCLFYSLLLKAFSEVVRAAPGDQRRYLKHEPEAPNGKRGAAYSRSVCLPTTRFVDVKKNHTPKEAALANWSNRRRTTSIKPGGRKRLPSPPGTSWLMPRPVPRPSPCPQRRPSTNGQRPPRPVMRLP